MSAVIRVLGSLQMKCENVNNMLSADRNGTVVRPKFIHLEEEEETVH